MEGQAQILAAEIYRMARCGGGHIWVHSAVYDGPHEEFTTCPCNPALVVVDPLN